jgi:hypothetical protein
MNNCRSNATIAGMIPFEQFSRPPSRALSIWLDWGRKFAKAIKKCFVQSAGRSPVPLPMPGVCNGQNVSIVQIGQVRANPTIDILHRQPFLPIRSTEQNRLTQSLCRENSWTPPIEPSTQWQQNTSCVSCARSPLMPPASSTTQLGV